MNEIKLPKEKELAEKMLSAHIEEATRKQEMGAVGGFLGSRREKPGNIAACAIMVACVMIVIVSFLPGGTDFPRKEILMLLAGVIPLALVYLFGFARGERSS